MKKYFLLILILNLTICLQTVAQGDLLLTPKRVVFEGNTKQAKLSIMNIGKDTATYSISFRQYNMTKTGEMLLIEKPDTTQMVADPFIRIFPRRVTLLPGEGQVVMLQCRRKADMKAGEYRSHLWFRDERNYEALESKDKPALDANQMSVSLTAIYGVTIPVLIYSGNVNVGATLSDLNLKMQHDTIPYLNVTVNRTGNISLRGKLTVEYVPVKGKPYEIGATNVVIYTSINERNISINLNKTPGMSLKTGILKVHLISLDDAKKKEVFAEAELDLK